MFQCKIQHFLINFVTNNIITNILKLNRKSYSMIPRKHDDTQLCLAFQELPDMYIKNGIDVILWTVYKSGNSPQGHRTELIFPRSHWAEKYASLTMISAIPTKKGVFSQ